MSLLSFVERLAAVDHSAVAFYPDRCLHALDRESDCTACYQICPAQAITAGSPPTFDPQKCQGCLACLPVCPTGAYYMAEDGINVLLANAVQVTARQIELVCGLHPEPQLGTSERAAGLRVRTCLAGLGAGMLMELAAHGFEHIILRCDACGECPWGGLRSTIQAQAAEAGQLLAHWDKADVVVISQSLENPVKRPLWKATDQSVSRRNLFQAAVQTVKAEPEKLPSAEARLPGRDRIRKLQAAFDLGEPLNPAAVLPQNEFTQLSARDTCTACGVCERVCPTGALHLAMDNEKQRFNLVFYARNCIHCDYCVRACMPGALYVDGQARFQHVFRTPKPVSLQSGELVRCERCNTPIAAKSGKYLCTLCEFRRTHPFGTQLPPGFKPPFNGRKNLS
jgi:energy-converting hydrogenase A subunit P